MSFNLDLNISSQRCNFCPLAPQTMWSIFSLAVLDWPGDNASLANIAVLAQAREAAKQQESFAS